MSGFHRHHAQLLALSKCHVANIPLAGCLTFGEVMRASACVRTRQVFSLLTAVARAETADCQSQSLYQIVSSMHLKNNICPELLDDCTISSNLADFDMIHEHCCTMTMRNPKYHWRCTNICVQALTTCRIYSFCMEFCDLSLKIKTCISVCALHVTPHT